MPYSVVLYIYIYIYTYIYKSYLAFLWASYQGELVEITRLKMTGFSLGSK